MNTNNFKIFVEALEALPEEIKNNKVDMRSNFAHSCMSESLSRILKQALASPIYSALCRSCFSLNASSLYIFLLFIVSSPYSCQN
jgi:hypothetical protein